jgi:hypothetical protein
VSFRIEQTPDRTVIRDVPTAMWVFGSVFVASGLFVLGMPVRSVEWSTFGFWPRVAVLAIGAAHLSVGCWTVWRSVSTVTTLERTTGEAVHAVRHPFRRDHRVTRFRLSDARAVELRRSTDGDGDPMYQMVLWLEGSRALALQGSPAHGEKRAELRAASVRTALSLPERLEPVPMLEA